MTAEQVIGAGLMHTGDNSRPDSSRLKSKFTWIATTGGAGGMVGGAIGLMLDIGSAGLSGGAGTLIGFTIGAAIGALFNGRSGDSRPD
jgi:hypothetical protein